MKKTINNALNEINDKYIEEACNTDSLQNNAVKTVRNIAIPVASAAAIAGLCLGLGKLGVFGGNGGVDLLPESTTNGAGDTSAIVVDDPQYEYIGYTPILPDTMPVVLQTSEHIEGIIFGSQFPEMIYADEDSAMFTDGISGLYIFDFDTEQITFAADIYTTFDMALTDYPQKIGSGSGTNYGGDSWNGIDLFAGADGTPYCSLAYHSDVVLTGSGQPMQSQWETKYYEIDTEELTLTALPDGELTIPVYDGLKEIPYSENEDYRNMSQNAAYIRDTDEFVYIRNSPADIDLLPEYSMEYIELRRWTSEEVTGEPMEGGYYPFSKDVGKDAVLYSSYYTTPYEVVENAHGIDFDGVEFSFDVWADVVSLPAGRYTLYGDIISLVEETSGYKWLYRIDGDNLIPLDIIGEQSADADIELKYNGETLYKNSDMLAEEVLPTAYKQIAGYRDEVMRKLESDMLNNEANRKDLEAQLEDYKAALAELEQKMKEAGYFTADVQDFLASLDPRVAAAVQEFIPAAPDDVFWGTSSAEKPYGIVTADAIRSFNEHILGMDEGAAESVLNDDQLVYSMCLNSYWNEAEDLNIAISEMIWNAENGYTGSAAMTQMLYPLDEKYNYVTAYFGYDSFRDGTHYGIDIADEGIGGADIYAAQEGLVIAAQNDSGWHSGLGNFVIIDHGNGYCTLYAHCYEVYVSAGDEVKRGDTIATVGTTGWSTGNHLHFEVRKDGVAVDPLYIGFSASDVQLVEYDAFEAALEYAFENVGEPVFPASIAQPIESDADVVHYDEYTEYSSCSNAEVYAADKGEIVFAGYIDATDECCIIIMHEGYVTVYRGLSDYKLVEGDAVYMGQTIGTAGEDGVIYFEIHTEKEVSADENNVGICRPITDDEDIGAILETPFAEAGEPNIPAQLYAPVDANAGSVSEYFYGDYRYGFGGYYGHKGVDIAAELGTEVKAAADGRVIAAAWCADYGSCVIIMHDGYATIYGHLSEMSVAEGDTVTAGQLIGAVGSTGKSTGNHLHFELRTAPEVQINPIDYLPYTE